MLGKREMATFLALACWKAVLIFKKGYTGRRSNHMHFSRSGGNTVEEKSNGSPGFDTHLFTWDGRNPAGTSLNIKKNCVGFGNQTLIWVGIDLTLGIIESGNSFKAHGFRYNLHAVTCKDINYTIL